MTEPEIIDGERTAIRIRRRYPHPIDRVWRGLTEAENLRHWFPSEITLTAEPGGVVRYGPDDEGRVEVAEPPTRLAFTWGDDLLDFELIADGDATDLLLTHHFGDRAGAASFATGWEQCLAGLTDVLEGREPPTATDRSEGRHEELVMLFGLDQPVIERNESGWRVRFERQLICDAQVAWDLFLDEVPETAGTVTASEPRTRLHFTPAATEPGESVSLTLARGTGHGARLVVEISGTDETEIEAAVHRWGAGAIGRVVRQAARLAGVG